MTAVAKPRRTKKAQAEATRSAIIDAAIRLFAKSGYVSTTTQDIARAIKMTPGVLYWHFKDKEEVLIAVLAELEQRLAATLTAEAETTAAAKLDAASTLERLIARVASVVEHHQDLLLLVGVIGAEITDQNARVEKALRTTYRRFAGVLRGLLDEGLEEGVVSEALDLDCAAEMFMGLYMGGILHQRLFRDDFPVERALPVLRQMLLGTVMPKAAAK